VKFRGNPYGNGRAIFTEQVVGLLGRLISAPVPGVKLVSVTAELIAPLSIDFNGQPATAGLHHGSCWAYDFSDRSEFLRYQDRNRPAFAALHLLYSWLGAGDHQLIYRNSEPHDVMSVDHSAFLPGGSGWTAQSLRDQQDVLAMDANFAPLNLADEEHSEALDASTAVSPQAIAEVAATPPDDWGVPLSDRVAFAEYVARRRIVLLANFGRTAE
jgi:hypothetical protein